jgi:hypothetical protein
MSSKPDDPHNHGIRGTTRGGAPADERVGRLLRDAAPARFDRGFSDRVVARLAEGGRMASALDFTAALERHFLRVVPILAAASLILGLYSWWGGRQTADSLLDATLRLPQVSIATVYEPELLYTTGDDN